MKNNFYILTYTNHDMKSNKKGWVWLVYKILWRQEQNAREPKRTYIR